MQGLPAGFLEGGGPNRAFPCPLALCRDDRAEGFLVLQTRCDFTENPRESGVILWCGLVAEILTFQVSVRPLVEPACCALLRS